MMEPCSNDFPKTDDFYRELSSDVPAIVLLSIGCLLAIVCVAIFIEELVFLQRVYCGQDIKIRRLATILGVYPVTVVTSLIPLLVPASTILIDLIGSCYLSVCFYTFVTLTIDYFGGEDKMLEILADDKIQISTPPCCCCCCCLLKPIKLTRKSLLYFKLFSLQVAVIRPLLLFVAAVLWTDGRYEKDINGSTSYLYITIITVASTLTSIYGTMVIVRASKIHLKQYRLWMKYMSFKILLVLVNVQTILFAILSAFDLPECIGTRGPTVRGSYIHHSALVIEAFLLTLLARKAYRRDETKVKGPVVPSDEPGFAPCDVVVDKQVDIVDTNGDDGVFGNNAKYLGENGYQAYDNRGADLSETTASDGEEADCRLAHDGSIDVSNIAP